MAEDRVSGEPKVWTCDGCSSWTDRPVRLRTLLNEWYWVVADDGPVADRDGNGEGVFCPECQ